MVSGTTRQPDEIIGRLPPRSGRATVEKIAVNAVMAGCKPAYLRLDNRKQNAGILLAHLAERLSTEYGMAEAVHHAKFIYSRVAEPALIDALAERCDFAVAAIGD